MDKPSKKHQPLDPAALARIREDARHLPAKSSRSRLAGLEDTIWDMRAKGISYKAISAFVRDRTGWSPACSVIHDFVRAIRKRRSKERRSKMYLPPALTPSPAVQQPAHGKPSQASFSDKENAVRDAIRAVKGQTKAANAQEGKQLSKYDLAKPLISEQEPDTNI